MKLKFNVYHTLGFLVLITAFLILFVWCPPINGFGWAPAQFKNIFEPYHELYEMLKVHDPELLAEAEADYSESKGLYSNIGPNGPGPTHSVYEGFNLGFFLFQVIIFISSCYTLYTTCMKLYTIILGVKHNKFQWTLEDIKLSAMCIFWIRLSLALLYGFFFEPAWYVVLQNDTFNFCSGVLKSLFSMFRWIISELFGIELGSDSKTRPKAEQTMSSPREGPKPKPRHSMASPSEHDNSPKKSGWSWPTSGLFKSGSTSISGNNQPTYQELGFMGSIRTENQTCRALETKRDAVMGGAPLEGGPYSPRTDKRLRDKTVEKLSKKVHDCRTKFTSFLEGMEKGLSISRTPGASGSTKKTTTNVEASVNIRDQEFKIGKSSSEKRT